MYPFKCICANTYHLLETEIRLTTHSTRRRDQNVRGKNVQQCSACLLVKLCPPASYVASIFEESTLMDVDEDNISDSYLCMLCFSSRIDFLALNRISQLMHRLIHSHHPPHRSTSHLLLPKLPVPMPHYQKRNPRNDESRVSQWIPIMKMVTGISRSQITSSVLKTMTPFFRPILQRQADTVPRTTQR